MQAKDLVLTLGGAPLFDGVDIALIKGERACLVGANGAGKSTLLKVLAGAIQPDGGVLARAGGVTIASVPQEPDIGAFPTLSAYVESGFDRPIPHYRAEAALEDFDLKADRSPQGLSGGETRRAALARAFAADADILLLDEPTNHLDIATIEALEKQLAVFKGAALIISHDRRFLERASDTMYWLRQRRVIKRNRGFSAFEAWALEVETEDARALARLETHLKAEEHWLRRGVTARRSRNEGRRRRLLAMRQERRDRNALTRGAGLSLAAGSASDHSRLVLEAKGVQKAFGDIAILRNFSVRVMRGDRIGIIGPNGAGKTTLLDVLLGRQTADSGDIRRAPGLTIAYIDQTRALLDLSATVRDVLTPLGGDQVMVRGQPRHVAAYAREFLFGPEHLRQPVAALSGGERNRLALAVTLTQQADVLVLDEPTNDLDADTLDALEDMVDGFDGTVLIVSHDRAFLDSVTTQILGALGDGVWVETPGGYDDFVREHGGFGNTATRGPKPEEKPVPAVEPKRVSRKLSYKDARRLEELEGLMPAWEAEIQTLEARLADADWFGRDPKAYQAASVRLEEVKRQKDEGETEWLTLEALRESLMS